MWVGLGWCGSIHSISINSRSSMLVSVYIRKQDEDKWRLLPKKTEAISRMLNGSKLDSVVINEVVGAVSTPSTTSISSDRFKQGLCKIHGLPLDSRGRCLQKGCKYA